MGEILIIAADPTEREGLALTMELHGHHCATVASVTEAVGLLGTRSFDLVIMELTTEGSDAGQSVKSLRETSPRVRVMILSRRSVAQNLPLADFYAAIPCSSEKLQSSIRQALEKKPSISLLPRPSTKKYPAIELRKSHRRV